MPKLNLYNLYDNGKLILEEVKSREIRKFLNTDIRVSEYAAEEKMFDGRYTFEVLEPRKKVDVVEQIAFEIRWEETVKLFKNVLWVKNGGKRLRVGGR